MIVRSAIAALAFLLGSGANIASPLLSEQAAADIVHTFCTTLIPEIAGYDPNDPNAPDPNDPAVFEPLVTPELAAIITRTQERSAAIEQATGEKPPLGDGVPWKGFQDAASDCSSGTISGTPDRPQVEVRYTYDLQPNEGWKDRLVLVRSEEEWRIDDILYGAFNYTTGLRSVLSATEAERHRNDSTGGKRSSATDGPASHAAQPLKRPLR